ncbi:hypothetical protein HAV15_002017 [Penicillium sp. str. |nr:hypothetical protein HAV15_002017 [Penicillium sp. str. \
MEGVDPDSTDLFGRTPLSHATEHENMAAFKLLLATEASTQTPLLSHIEGQSLCLLAQARDSPPPCKTGRPGLVNYGGSLR